jgi:hypothetical protein
MKIELNSQQCELLRELLEAAHRDRVHELHRTTALGYKRILREKVELIEDLCERVADADTITR